MFPGLMRSFAAPSRAASTAIVWSKWTSATTGSGDAGADGGEPVQRVSAGNRHAHDLAAGLGQPADLGQSGDSVAGVGGGHRLD